MFDFKLTKMLWCFTSLYLDSELNMNEPMWGDLNSKGSTKKKKKTRGEIRHSKIHEDISPKMEKC